VAASQVLEEMLAKIFYKETLDVLKVAEVVRKIKKAPTNLVETLVVIFLLEIALQRGSKSLV
jgi:hypothetical protein